MLQDVVEADGVEPFGSQLRKTGREFPVNYAVEFSRRHLGGGGVRFYSPYLAVWDRLLYLCTEVTRSATDIKQPPASGRNKSDHLWARHLVIPQGFRDVLI